MGARGECLNHLRRWRGRPGADTASTGRRGRARALRSHRIPRVRGRRMSRSKAKLDDGYLKMANRLLEAKIRARLTASESRIFDALVRMTYGWGRKEITISLRELAFRA